MARQIDSEITGVIDNLIFYERQGVYLIRTLPFQTAASKKSAIQYGFASTKAKILRQLLLPLLPNPKDRDMQNRLTPAMREFLSALSDNTSINPFDNPLAGFRFVVTSDLKNCLHFSIGLTPQVDGSVHIEIPVINPYQSFSAPEGTSRIELRMMAVTFNTGNNHGTASKAAVFNTPYVNEVQPAATIILDMPAEDGSILVIAAVLSYFDNERLINKEGYMPAEIVGVFTNI